MDPDGSNRRQLTDNLGIGDVGRLWEVNLGPEVPNLAWSPDYTTILYRDGDVWSGWSIWSTDREGTSQMRLDTGFYAVFSPDGARIAYARRGGIWLMNADGTDRMQLAASGRCPAWSPDGDTVAYEDEGIWLIGADGASRRQLTEAGRCPKWVSPAS